MSEVTCYQCGYCCYRLRVAIINPSYIEILKNVTNASQIEDHHIMMKEPKTDCPYLNWVDKNTTICTIHEYPVYKLTYCYYFTNSFVNDTYCLVGNNIKENDIDTKQYVNSIDQD